MTIAIVGVALAGLSVFYYGESIPQTTFAGESNVFSELAMMETDGVKHLIPLDRIKGGGPPKDEFHPLTIPYLQMCKVPSLCLILTP